MAADEAQDVAEDLEDELSASDPDDDEDGEGSDPGDEDESEGEGEGDDAGAEDPAHVAARLAEKESQARGLGVALNQERQARREADARAKQLEHRLYLVLDKAIAAQHGGEEPEPDPEDAVVDRITERMAKTLQPVIDRDNQRAQEAVINENIDRVQKWVASDRQAAMQTLPGYKEAEDHVGRVLYNDIHSRLSVARPDLDEDQIAAVAWHHYTSQIATFQIAHAQQGKSLAQSLYQWALRSGFTPSEAGDMARVRSGAQSRRGAPASAPQARRPLPRTTKAMLDLTDDEFSDALEQMGSKNFERFLEDLADRN